MFRPLSDLTPERLAELRRIAEEARPGPWFFGNTDPSQRIILGGNTGRYVATVIIHQIPRMMGLLDEEQREANARHIAAFDPTTALALLDRIEELEAENERLRQIEAVARTLVDTAFEVPGPGEYVYQGVRVDHFNMLAALLKGEGGATYA